MSAQKDRVLNEIKIKLHAEKIEKQNERSLSLFANHWSFLMQIQNVNPQFFTYLREDEKPLCKNHKWSPKKDDRQHNLRRHEGNVTLIFIDVICDGGRRNLRFFLRLIRSLRSRPMLICMAKKLNMCYHF